MKPPKLPRTCVDVLFDTGPLECKVIAPDISIHWFKNGAKKGSKCLCGKTKRKVAHTREKRK